MKIVFSLTLVLLTKLSFAQQYDSTRISTHTVINLLESNFIGFESYGTVYYVEPDLKTVVAVNKKTGHVKWKTDVVLACGIPAEGKHEIRYMKLHKGTLHVIYGKHNEAQIEQVDGSLFLCKAD